MSTAALLCAELLSRRSCRSVSCYTLKSWRRSLIEGLMTYMALVCMMQYLMAHVDHLNFDCRLSVLLPILQF